MDSSKRPDYQLQYTNAQPPPSYTYLQHGGAGMSGMDFKQPNNIQKQAPFPNHSQVLPEQYYQQKFQQQQQYKLDPTHSFPRLNQTPQPMNQISNKMAQQCSPSAAPLTNIRYNTSSSQSQYNYQEFNTPQKKHSASIAGQVNPIPYPMQSNPFLSSQQFPQIMMPQAQQQMDMLNMMQMFGMLRLPQAHNFDSHFSQMHKNLQNVQKKISQMQKDKPQPPSYYPGSAPGINSWQDMMMSQPSYHYPPPPPPHHNPTQAHSSPYIQSYMPLKNQRQQAHGFSSFNEERKQGPLSTSIHQPASKFNDDQNELKQKDIQINDLRPPTSIGVRPPQQEMLEKFDFKSQKQQPQITSSSGYRPVPDSENFLADRQKTPSKLQQKKNQRQQAKQMADQQRTFTIPSKNKHDQIPCARPQTFEQILKKNLDNAVKQDDQIDDIRRSAAQPKRTNYLKRNSKKVISKLPTDQKKYNYYIANFSSQVKDPRFDSNFNFKKKNFQDQADPGAGVVEDVVVKKLQNNKKEKQFLKRGGGTGGGKSASAAREQKNLMKAQAADKKNFQKHYQQSQQQLQSQIQDDLQERKNLNLKKRTSEMKANKKKLDIFKDDDSNDQDDGDVYDEDVNDELNSDNEYKSDMLENRIKIAHRQRYQDYPKNTAKGFGKLSGIPIPNSYLNQDDDDIEQLDDEDEDQDQKNKLLQQYQDEDEQDYRNQKKQNQPNRLVQKYFIKKKKKASQAKRAAAQSKKDKQALNLSQEKNDFQKQIIHSKIQQTEIAVKKLKKQNDLVRKHQQQLRRGLQKLARDRSQFQLQKKQQMQQLEEFKQQQLKKLKKQKKVMERQAKALSSQPNRKQRQQIQKLKIQVNKLNEELKTKQQRHKLYVDRLKRKNDQLSEKNSELQLEIKHIESISMSRSSSVKQQQRSNKNYQSGSAPRYNFTGGLVPKSKDQSSLKIQHKQQQQQQHGMSMEMQQVKQQVNEQDELTSGAAVSARRMRMSKDQDDEYFTHRGDRKIINNRNQEEEDEQEYDARNQDGEDEQQQIEEGQQEEEEQEEGEQVQDDDDDEDNDQETGLNNIRILRDLRNAQEQTKIRAPKSSEEADQSFEMVFPQKYHSSNGVAITSQNIAPNGKISRSFSNGKKEIVFNNGVKREIFPDGYTVVYFNNNDIKQTYPDGKVVYFFAEARTTQTTYQDNLQVFKFSNGQIQKHFPDGTKEINFPDGTVKCIFCDGEEESIFPDGTIQRIEQNGVKSIEYSNGQKDILQPDGVRIREFPDGKVRKTYPNGKVDTYMKDQL